MAVLRDLSVHPLVLKDVLVVEVYKAIGDAISHQASGIIEFGRNER